MLFTEKKGVFMNSTTLPGFVLLAQQGGSDLHDISKSIGGFAALLGIGLLIYFATRGKSKRQS
jgi:hypothetical protein